MVSAESIHSQMPVRCIGLVLASKIVYCKIVDVWVAVQEENYVEQ